MRFQEEMLRLYAITDRSCVRDGVLRDQVEAALRGGVTLVQLREKGLDDAALEKEARELTALCHCYGTALIVNDYVGVALRSGADGVHVGIGDAPVEDIRARAPEGFIIGATAKTVEQAQAAQRAGADYLGVGAVFPSPTKRQAIRITTQELKNICASVSIPAVAIGGIGYDNMLALKGGGMRGIAVVSAIFRADDIESAARSLRARAQELAGSGSESG